MEIAILSIIDKIYPVGCFFDTTDSSFNPNTTFGGTWERITDASVLMSEGYYEDGQLVTVGNNCGNNNPKIPLGAIPSHTHTYQKSNATSGSHKLTVNEIPSHSHTIKLAFRCGIQENANVGIPIDASRTDQNTTIKDVSTGGGQGHTHPISFATTNTGTSGSSNNFAVVQNSLVVCRWHRTA